MITVDSARARRRPRSKVEWRKWRRAPGTTPHDALLRRLYYDVERGFGSVAETLRRAKAEDPSVRRADVQDFLRSPGAAPGRQGPALQQLRAPALAAGAAADGPRRLRGRRRPSRIVYRYGLVAVDIFTKRLAVAPLRGKTAAECAEGLDAVLDRLGLPASVFTDQGGEFQGAFEARLRYYDIDHVVSRTPPIFVERQIRTIKEGVERRLRALRYAAPWYRMLQPVVDKYNATPQTTTRFAPNVAATGEHNAAVYRNIAKVARHDRRYPDLRVGDTVKVIRKAGKYSEFKAGFRHWSDEAFRFETQDFDGGLHL